MGRRSGRLRGGEHLPHVTRRFPRSHFRTHSRRFPANSVRAGLRAVRNRESRDRKVLSGVRIWACRRSPATGVPQDRDDRLLRPQGLHSHGREARFGVAPRGDDALLRLDERRARATRRRGREVHRRRDHGGLRASEAARGRRVTCGSCCCRHAARASGAERRARAPLGREADGSNRRQHGRGRRRRSDVGPASRHRGRRERGCTPGASRRSAGGAARRSHVPPGT